MNYNEPWKVKEYDLRQSPTPVFAADGEGWVSQSWRIDPSNSERSVCTVQFRTDSNAWGPTQNRNQALAYRDRIIACVNACAGMEDPEQEIKRLRELAATEPQDVATPNTP